jgi:hypothetical protein
MAQLSVKECFDLKSFYFLREGVMGCNDEKDLPFMGGVVQHTTGYMPMQ